MNCCRISKYDIYSLEYTRFSSACICTCKPTCTCTRHVCVHTYCCLQVKVTVWGSQLASYMYIICIYVNHYFLYLFTIISNVKFEIDCNCSKYVVTIVDVYDFNTIWTCIFDSPYHTIYKAGLEIPPSWQRGQETLPGREHCVSGQSQQQRSHCCHRNHGKDTHFNASPKWVKNSFSGM